MDISKMSNIKKGFDEDLKINIDPYHFGEYEDREEMIHKKGAIYNRRMKKPPDRLLVVPLKN